MHSKNLLVVGAVLSTAIIATAVFTFREALRPPPAGQGSAASPEAALDSGGVSTMPNSASLGFGPLREAVLHDPGIRGARELLNLETGRTLNDPDPQFLKLDARASMAWVRTNGLDISSSIWRDGAACVTYGMQVVPLAGGMWEQVAAQQLLTNRPLAADRPAPRRLLVLGHGCPDTYLFRTGNGTLGMLRLAGLSADGRGLRIYYKLVQARGITVGQGEATEVLVWRD